jgi:hypothetical protein
MTGTVKVREVIRRVSALLQDNNPQFARMTETEIVDFLNDAQTAIYTFLPSACSRIDSIKLVPGTLQGIDSIPAANCKPGDGSTPAVPIIGSQLLNIVCNMGSAGTVPGAPVRLLTEGRELLDTLNPAWHTESAVAVQYYVYDPATPRHFYVSPGVHATTAVWVRLAFVAMPLSIPNTGTAGAELYLSGGTNATTISVHDEYVDDLVNYVCARCLMKNAQYSASTGMSAEAFATMFTGSINAKSLALMNYNPNLQHLPFAPSPTGAAS